LSYPVEFWVSEAVIVWKRFLVFPLQCIGIFRLSPSLSPGKHQILEYTGLSGLPWKEKENDDLLSKQFNWDLSEFFLPELLKIHGTHGLIMGQDIGNQDSLEIRIPLGNLKHMAPIEVIQIDFQMEPQWLQNICNYDTKRLDRSNYLGPK
jgi:hypothetical protein